MDNPHPSTLPVPFTIAEGGWNSSEKTLTLTRNDKWWGEKPVLERIVFRQMDSAAERAAFKNDELDAIGATTAAAYKELKEVANTEMRRGARLLRRRSDHEPCPHGTLLCAAVVVGLNREAISKGAFQGLDYEEKLPWFDSYALLRVLPGRLPDPEQRCYCCFQDSGRGWLHQERRVLREKDGKRLPSVLSIFGDDPTSKAVGQTLGSAAEGPLY